MKNIFSILLLLSLAIFARVNSQCPAPMSDTTAAADTNAADADKTVADEDDDEDTNDLADDDDVA